MSGTALAQCALPIPPGPLMRAKAIKIDSESFAASRLAARILLTDGGRPDPQAVAHVVLAGPKPLAALAAERFTTPEDATARELASTAAELAPKSRLPVSTAIAFRCHQLGMGSAFAYPGTSELELCLAFAQLGDRGLLNARGDAEAVFLAGGAALATREVRGVAVVHGARGLTNSAGAIGDLRRNEVPAVILVGMPATSSARFLPPHGEDGLLAAVGEFAKASHQVEWPRHDLDVVSIIDRAWSAASAPPRGPVIVGFPQDILEAPVVRTDDLARRCPSVVPRLPRRWKIGRARSVIKAAKRTVILVDDYLLVDEAATAATSLLADRTDAALFQLRYRRGPMLFAQLTRSRFPRFSGSYDPTDPVHRSRMRSADLLITIEDRNMYPRVVGSLPTCRKIAVTSDPATTRRNGYLARTDLMLAGDPRLIVEQLASDLPPMTGPATDPSEPRTEVVVPRSVVRAEMELLRQALSLLVRGCIDLTGARHVVDDSQIAGGLLAGVYDQTFGDVTVHGDHSGFVGAGISLATGLAISQDSPVVCLIGDQGFTNGAQGLICAAQEQAPVLFIAANNGSSVSLTTQAEGLGIAPPAFERLLRNAPSYSYVEAAAAAGLPGAVLDLESGLPDGERVNQALAAVGGVWSHRGPGFVELLLPSAGPAWDGVWATTGLDDEPDRKTSAGSDGE